MQMIYKLSWTAMVDGEVKPWGRCDANGNMLVAPGAGVSLASTEYVEDAVAAANPQGGVGMGVAVTTPANEVPDADVVAARFTRKGEIHSKNIDLEAKLPASLGAKATTGSLSVANSFLTCAAGGDGSVNTAETITVANTVQLVEFFNLSANVIWASWTGTAAASTTGSFPIPALASGVAGYYSGPPGASGSLSIIAVGGASAFTCNLWS